MTSNVREFNLALDTFIGKQVPEIARAAHRKVVLDAHRKLVMKSPVDTGRFRGNWIVSTSSPNTGTTDVRDPGARGQPPGGASQSAALAAVGAMVPYSVAFIQNNLPYALRLEQGHSKQAPAGMVALTLAELTTELSGGLR